MPILISSNLSYGANINSMEDLMENLKQILLTLKKAIPKSEIIYALDASGLQITPNISTYADLDGKHMGKDRSNRSYYYVTKANHRCEISDPYPSILSKHLIVTASFPYMMRVIIYWHYLVWEL